MDYRKINFSNGFTLLELLIVLILIGLVSTVIVTNTSFIDEYKSDRVEPYKKFINFLSEESALTKKTLGWFIGKDAQSIYVLKMNEWYPYEFDSAFYPSVNSQILFKDAQGQQLLFSQEIEEPFLIFYPSGKSSGGEIYFDESNSSRVITVDTFGKVSESENFNVSSKRF